MAPTAPEPEPEAPPAEEPELALPQVLSREELDDLFSKKSSSRDARWTTEVFQDAITPILARLAEGIEHPTHLEVEHLRNIVLPDFECSPLLPRELAAVGDGGPVRVRRGGPSEERLATSDGLVRELARLGAMFEDAGENHVKFKVVGVEPLADELTRTKVWVQSYGDGPRHFDAHWTCTWKEADPPWLASIQLERYEEVQREAPSPLFADCTEAVLGDNDAFATLLRPGLRRWLAQLDIALGNHLFGQHGLAVADVNGDGLDDVYVCLNGGLPNQLLLQNPDGTASDHSRASGLDFLDHTRSALFIDIDNDGDQDAVIGSVDILFLENDGAGSFTLRGRVPGDGSVYSMVAADYDVDGDLDLYACRYTIGGKYLPHPFYDARNGPPNLMLRNEGDWTFLDVTDEVGLGDGNDRFSYAAAWSDYDADGDVDLYVANDFGRNNLYRNQQGTFRDVAAEARIEDVSAGMSAAWGDANNDGLPDMYISNMFSSAGSRVAYQDQFQEGTDEETRELFRRHARGSSLFLNAGDGTFRDVSVEEGVTLGRWAWGSSFADADNDGREDLFVANGFVTNDGPEDL